jgi:hypothetical protein
MWYVQFLAISSLPKLTLFQPLEEINRLFGDTDEVAVTQAQLSEKRYQLEGKSDNRV